jgi:hypothetical protein
MSVSAELRFSVQAHVVVAQVGEEAVILNTDSGRYFGLDAIGARIWRSLAQEPTAEQICADLLGEYDADPSDLRTDVVRLLEQLQACGLIAPTAAISA